MALITLTDGHLAWGDLPLLDGASFSVEPGERIGLIGRNGAGKSSLLAVLAGTTALDDGLLQRQDGLTVHYVEQEPLLPAAPTFRESLMLRGRVHEHDDEREGWRLAAKLDEYLTRFELDPEGDPAKASGGQRKRAALALAFALEPDLLLLDEPTNHLDLEAIALLEGLVNTGWRTSKSMVVITHDRQFLDNVSTRIIELDRGILRSYPGNFAAYESRKEEELAAETLERQRFDKFSGPRKKFGSAKGSKRAAPATKGASVVWSSCAANAPHDANVRAASSSRSTRAKRAAKSWPKSKGSRSRSATAFS